MLLPQLRMPSLLAATFWILLLGLTCPGCGPKTGRMGDKMWYILDSKGSNVSLTLDELTIEFEVLGASNGCIENSSFHISGDTIAN